MCARGKAWLLYHKHCRLMGWYAVCMVPLENPKVRAACNGRVQALQTRHPSRGLQCTRPCIPFNMLAVVLWHDTSSNNSSWIIDLHVVGCPHLSPMCHHNASPRAAAEFGHFANSLYHCIQLYSFASEVGQRLDFTGPIWVLCSAHG